MSPLHMLWIVPTAALGASLLLWLVAYWADKEMARVAAEATQQLRKMEQAS